ncbi:DUF502 domain-containing protein [candidate division KSB1 bacterium]|nr:DUF502 domain-containing protein [candidate division KSB1 bacterium]
MTVVWKHIKKYTISGVLAIMPLALIYLVLRFLYFSIDRQVINLVDDLIGFRIPGLGIVLVIVVLYFIGLLANNYAGKWILNNIDKLTKRIPIIGTTYQVGKQISGSLGLPEKQVFKRVVLVDFLKPGIWTIGFVTGEILDKKTGQKLLKVFVPTPPNPTSGTMVVVKEPETRDPGWTVEEALKTVISGGIIGPNEIL